MDTAKHEKKKIFEQDQVQIQKKIIQLCIEERGAVWGDLVNGLRFLPPFHTLPNFSADQMFLNQFPIGLLSQAGYISRQNHLRNKRGAEEDFMEPGEDTIQMEILCRLDKMYIGTKLQIFRAKKTCSANQDLIILIFLKT